MLWYVNWTGLEDLYTIIGEDFPWDQNYQHFNELVKDCVWHEDTLKKILPVEYVNHIMTYIKVPEVGKGKGKDKIRWMLEAKAKFSVKSTWEYIRPKETPNSIYKKIWVKGLLFKMSFLMWRAWKFMSQVDDRVRRWEIEGPSRCWCCDNPINGTLYHVLLRSYISKRTCSYFASCAGINVTGLYLRKTIMQWWNSQIKKDISSYYNDLPSIIIWKLWKIRNIKKHEGKNTTLHKVIHNITRNMWMLLKVRKLGRTFAVNWKEILSKLVNITPRLKVTQVMWGIPSRWMGQVYIDEVLRGNPRPSSYVYCVGDAKGDLIDAEYGVIEDIDSIQADTTSLVHVSKHYSKSNHKQAIFQTDSLILSKVMQKE